MKKVILKLSSKTKVKTNKELVLSESSIKVGDLDYERKLRKRLTDLRRAKDLVDKGIETAKKENNTDLVTALTEKSQEIQKLIDEVNTDLIDQENSSDDDNDSENEVKDEENESEDEENDSEDEDEEDSEEDSDDENNSENELEDEENIEDSEESEDNQDNENSPQADSDGSHDSDSDDLDDDNDNSNDNSEDESDDEEESVEEEDTDDDEEFDDEEEFDGDEEDASELTDDEENNEDHDDESNSEIDNEEDSEEDSTDLDNSEELEQDEDNEDSEEDLDSSTEQDDSEDYDSDDSEDDSHDDTSEIESTEESEDEDDSENNTEEDSNSQEEDENNSETDSEGNSEDDYENDSEDDDPEDDSEEESEGESEGTENIEDSEKLEDESEDEIEDEDEVEDESEDEIEDEPIKDPFADEEDIPTPPKSNNDKKPRDATLKDIIHQLTDLNVKSKRGAIAAIKDLLAQKEDEETNESFKIDFAKKSHLVEALKGVREMTDDEFGDYLNGIYDLIDQVEELEYIDDMEERKNKIKAWADDPATAQELAAEDNIELQKDQQKIKASEKEKQKYSQMSSLDDFSIDLFNAINYQIDLVKQVYLSYEEPNSEYEDSDLIMRTEIEREIPDEAWPIIDIYFDVSGSWTAQDIKTGMQAIASIKKFEDAGELIVNVFYWDDQVSDRPYLASVKGGTSGWQKVLANIHATKASNVMIMTDSDIAYYDDLADRNSNARPYSAKYGPSVVVDGCVWYLWKNGSRSPECVKKLTGKQGTYQYSF